MTDIVRADTGVDTVIWLVVAFFWAIAQFLAKASKSRRPPGSPSSPPPVPPGNGGTIQDDLQELFDTLRKAQSGMEIETKPPPDLAKPMPPLPYAAKQQPQRKVVRKKVAMEVRAPTNATPVPPHGRHKPSKAAPVPPPLVPTAKPDAGNLANIQAAHDVAYVHAPPPQSARRVVSSSGGIAMLSASFFRMKALRLPLSTGGLSTHEQWMRQGHTRRLFAGRKALRDAVISRIVLGPPKAL